KRPRLFTRSRAPVRRDRRAHRGHGRKVAGSAGIGPGSHFGLRRGRPGRGSNFGGSVSDKYAELVNSGLAGKLAKALGLPRPARLRRYAPGDDAAAGPVLILDGDHPASAKDGDALAEVLLEWGVDVRRHPEGEKFAAIIPVFSGAQE